MLVDGEPANAILWSMAREHAKVLADSSDSPSSYHAGHPSSRSNQLDAGASLAQADEVHWWCGGERVSANSGTPKLPVINQWLNRIFGRLVVSLAINWR